MTEFFVLITLQMPTNGGFVARTLDVTVTLAPETTRAELYKTVRGWIAEQTPEWATATVLCFVGEPNQPGAVTA